MGMAKNKLIDMVSGSLALHVVKLQRVAGQQPQEGTKSSRMGKSLMIMPVHPSIHLPPPPGWPSTPAEM